MRGASCSTPTCRAARAENLPPTPAPHCCSTGSRWAARCVSKAASSTSPTPRRMRITRRVRASRASAPGRRISRACCRSGPSWSAASRRTKRSIRARTSRARPTGPASASSRSASSSGRTCRSGCTIARCTPRRRAAAGHWENCSPDTPVTAPPQQAEVVAFLRGLAGTEPLETHISLVFVGTDAVWKLKKAVRLAFLDFTSLEARQRFTLRELELNRPAAPGLYRDVVPVVRCVDGTLGFGETGEHPVVDWVLRMAPVPAGDFLDAIAASGRLTAELLDALGDAVAAFHRGLTPATGTDVVTAMRNIANGNAESARDAGLAEDAVQARQTGVLAALDAMAPWLAQRERDGFVRRAHGDLHLGNLCLWQGRPVPFDALEFDEAMATIDLGYDLAFLLMDLDQRVSRAAANRVLNRYVARTGDAALTRGLPVFLSLRAMIRTHVEARRGNRDIAAHYLSAAATYLVPKPAFVLAIGGLPGSGKSTLARAVAPELG